MFQALYVYIFNKQKRNILNNKSSPREYSSVVNGQCIIYARSGVQTPVTTKKQPKQVLPAQGVSDQT